MCGKRLTLDVFRIKYPKVILQYPVYQTLCHSLVVGTSKSDVEQQQSTISSVLTPHNEHTHRSLILNSRASELYRARTLPYIEKVSTTS